MQQSDQATLGGRTALRVAFAVNAGFAIAEMVAGLAANSIALVADATHNGADVLTILIGLVALRMVEAPPSHERTYGLRRMDALAAIVNAAIIAMAGAVLAYEAIDRLLQPRPLGGLPVLLMALGGVAVNGGVALILARTSRELLAARSVFINLVADTSISAATAVAGVVLLAGGPPRIDAVVGLLVVVALAITVWGLLRDTLNVLLEATPRHVDLHRLEEEIGTLDGVTSAHDVHVWTIGAGLTALSAHVEVADIRTADAVVACVGALARQRFGIAHSTVQVTTDGAGGHDDLCTPPCEPAASPLGQQ